MTAYESVSTWKQPPAPPPSEVRAGLLRQVAGSICSLSPQRVRVAVDGVFAFRPEYDELWDYRIWIDVSPELSRERGTARDTLLEGESEAARLYDQRYRVGEQLYVDEVAPKERADVVVDNTVLDRPRTITP